MEYLYILLFFLAFAMVGLMIGLTLEEAFADYFDAVNIRYNDNPVTCIFEPARSSLRRFFGAAATSDVQAHPTRCSV